MLGWDSSLCAVTNNQSSLGQVSHPRASATLEEDKGVWLNVIGHLQLFETFSSLFLEAVEG